MSRFRTPLLIIGILGSVIVGVIVVIVLLTSTGGPTTSILVACEGILPGTILEKEILCLEEVEGLSQKSVQQYVTPSNYGQFAGYPVREYVPARVPLAISAVMTGSADLRYTPRLTSLLADEDNLVFPLDVTAGQAGNYVVLGDYVDVIFTLGRAAKSELVHAEEIAGSSGAVTSTLRAIDVGPQDGHVVTTTLHLPMAKVILPNVRVLWVEREQVQSTSYTYSDETSQAQTTKVQGDVERLYLEVNREQAEVLAFALHNGYLNLPARTEPLDGATEGLLWEDFEDVVFADRPAEELRGEK